MPESATEKNTAFAYTDRFDIYMQFGVKINKNMEEK